MIRLVCPSCQKTLNARGDLVGQTRNCPACGASVDIPAELPASGEVAAHVPEDTVAEERPAPIQAQEEAIDTFRPPKQLDRTNRYYICDRTGVIAGLEPGGKGWTVKTSAGWLPAARNTDKLPHEGDFKLVELKMEGSETGGRLVGLTAYQLAERWALTRLTGADDEILAAVTGPGSLRREQKSAIRLLIRDRLMPPVYEDARTVLDYLANSDYSSPGPG